MAERIKCPKCGAPAYETGQHCMSCGGDLQGLLAEAKQREEEERQQAEAAAQLEAAKSFVADARNAGTGLGEIYISLVDAGWPQEQAHELVRPPEALATAASLPPGSTCPYCQHAIKHLARFVQCPVCGIPHHKQCWEENGGCAVYGCRGDAQMVRDPSTTLPDEEHELRGEALDALASVFSAIEVGVSHESYPTYVISAKQTLDRLMSRTSLSRSAYWHEMEEAVTDLKLALDIWRAAAAPPGFLLTSSQEYSHALERYPELSNALQIQMLFPGGAVEMDAIRQAAWASARQHVDLARQVVEYP